MANLLDRFNIDVIGSSGRISDNMSLISPKGDFKRIIDFDVILSSWNNILLTPTRSYFYDPEYGSNLYKYIFDPSDEETVEQIKDEILDKLMYYDNRATIEDIKVEFTTDKKGFNITIFAKYEGEHRELSLWLGEDIFSDFLRTS